MTDEQRLDARIRWMKFTMAILFVATAVVDVFSHGSFRNAVRGLLIGEIGGVYVMFSMIRQGHLKDGLMGNALFAAGMVGMVMRWVALGLVLYVAYKLHASFVGALLGYLSGFGIIFISLSSFLRNPGTRTGQKVGERK